MICAVYKYCNIVTLITLSINEIIKNNTNVKTNKTIKGENQQTLEKLEIH